MGSAIDIKTELKKSAESIDSYLDTYFAGSDVNKYVSKYGAEAWEMLQDFSTRSSKRVRGTILLKSYKMFGGDNFEEAMKAAIAIEFIQNYLLIVDDVMDRSSIRRSKPTIHMMYRDKMEKIGVNDSEHIGDMLAINVALIACHAASEIMSSLDVDPSRVTQANVAFHRNIAMTGFGQIDDLFSGIDITSEEDILRMHEFKSSYYTFINPMQIGAILAGSKKEDLDAIVDFGTSAGIAFQLQDDIIGLFGESDNTGKSSLDDLKEGKYTLLIERTLEAAEEDKVRILKKALGNKDVTQEEADEVRDIIKECGAFDYASDRAKSFSKDALEVLNKQNWPEADSLFFEQLTKFIVNRTK